jgi:hypothetical protein
LIRLALADRTRGSIERGLAASVSHPDLIFLNAVGRELRFFAAMGRWKMIVRVAVLVLLLATSSSLAEDSSPTPDSFMERLCEGLMVGHPDMPTFRFTREDARAFLLYLRSIQAP